jgi:hypothetical protein
MFISLKESTLTDTPQPAKEFGGYTDVAKALAIAFPNPQERGLKAFTRQQVHVWWLRRERNLFPGKYPRVVNGVKKELFRVSEVVDWYRGYVPSTGGRQAASGSQETAQETAS